MPDEGQYHEDMQNLRAELRVLRGEADESPVRRVTNTEVLRTLLERLRRQATPSENTVKLARNAKGDIQYEVSARADTLDEALAEAVRVEGALATIYPYGGTPVRPSEGSGDGGA